MSGGAVVKNLSFIIFILNIYGVGDTI